MSTYSIHTFRFIKISGVGKAQYIYWAIISSITFVDFADLVVVATIVPVLRCEWDLDLLWETMINICSFFFSAISGALLGKLPDIYGRRKALSIALFSQFLAVGASALAQNKVQFLIFRSIMGVTAGITFPTAMVFTTEIVKNSHREVGPLIIQLVVASSEFLCAVAVFLTLDMIGWRWFIFATSSPIIICLVLLVWIVPESPRYLVVSGQMDRAKHALQKMANLNGARLPENLSVTVHKNQELGSIADLFRPEFRRQSLLLSAMFFCNLLIIFAALVFMPLALYSGFCGGSKTPPEHVCVKIKQNSLLELAIACSGSLLAAIVGYFLATRIGRSITMKIFSTISFISILFLFKCFSTIITTVSFFLIKFLQYSHHINMFFIIPEFYPTTFRNTAISIINSCGKFGGVIGTGLVYVLYYQSPYLVVAMFAVASLVTCVCSWIWNTETKDAEMRDIKDTTIQQTKSLTSKSEL